MGGWSSRCSYSDHLDAVRTFGSNAWQKNQKLCIEGEKRILKELPITLELDWADWGKAPGGIVG